MICITLLSECQLNPEFTTQYDVGLTYARQFVRGVLERIEFQTDAYYNEASDKSVAMPTSNQVRWTMMNLGYVEIRGSMSLCKVTGVSGNISWLTSG